MSYTLAFVMGMPGPMELVIIAAVVLLLFGKRVPQVMYSLGSSFTQFKKGLNDIEELPENLRKTVDEAGKPNEKGS